MLFLARVDGTLEVWDMLEATHQPVANVPVAAVALTSIAINASPAASAASSRSLVAVGESPPELESSEMLRMPPCRLQGPLWHSF